MTSFDPKLLATTDVPEASPDITIPSDPLAQTQRWQELQLIASERPLNSLEIQEMVTITRALRRTNTGPAKAKTAKSGKAKVAISTEELLGD